ASRLDAGPLRIFSRLERVAGGETRVGIGLETRVPLGFRCFLSREEGPVLAESRAGGIEWESGGQRAHTAHHSSTPSDTSTEAVGEAEWDSLAHTDALENEVEADATPSSDEPVDISQPRETAQDNEPAALSWRATVGGRPDRESGLGSSAAVAYRSPPG